MSNMDRFTSVPKVEVPRAQFDRSHNLKTTFDGDLLIPCLVQEIYPGDTLQVDMSFMARMSTPLYPVMHDFYLDSFFFFCPTRLVWENARRFFGERHPDPSTTIDLTIPVVTLDQDKSTVHGNQTFDYMGIPLIDYSAANYTCNALPFRAYHRIYNEWFRDQNLQDSYDYGLKVDAGPEGDNASTEHGKLHKRGKRHDYFTSALPWLQKGDAVELPLGTAADVITSATATITGAQEALQLLEATAGAAPGQHVLVSDAASDLADTNLSSGTPGAKLYPSNLYADLTGATAATVNEVRQAFQIQRLLERDARGGTRYPELVKSHFGVNFPDLTYRPEYLGGGSEPINITPIPNTDINTGVDGAAVSGQATAHGTGHGFVKSFSEHGYVIGIVSARADLGYQEGMEKMWTRSTRYDFYWPSLANIGEQAILNREICLDDVMITASDDDGVFGYQERYAELKYQPNRVCGDFRSNAGTPLDAWHLVEELGDGIGGFPLLDDSFIEANTPWDRVTVGSGPDFIMDAWFNMKHTRCMPVYSIPGMIDHF